MPRFFSEVPIVNGAPDLPGTVRAFSVVEDLGNGRVVVETDVRVNTHGPTARRNRDNDFPTNHPLGLGVPDRDPNFRTRGESAELRRLRLQAYAEGRTPTPAELDDAEARARARRRAARDSAAARRRLGVR